MEGNHLFKLDQNAIRFLKKCYGLGVLGRRGIILFPWLRPPKSLCVICFKLVLVLYCNEHYNKRCSISKAPHTPALYCKCPRSLTVSWMQVSPDGSPHIHTLKGKRSQTCWQTLARTQDLTAVSSEQRPYFSNNDKIA